MRRALLVPPLLLLAACGGGGGDDAKQAYVDRATAVCSEADAEFGKLTQPTTADGFAPFVDSTVAIAEKAQTELDALTPPEADAQELRTKVLDPFGALVEEGKAFSAKVKAAGSDQAKLLPLLSQRPTAASIDLDYLRSYGLETCADTIDQAG